MECLTKVNTGDSNAKMELITTVMDLMPEGKPKFLEVIKYPKIADIVKVEGRKNTLFIISLIVRNFCSSINVVRNMNEDQIIETAAMLLNECDNFRLEDYIMMFEMAKTGKLVKIMDRIDMQVVSSIMDEYYIIRRREGKKAQEEEHERLESLGNTTKQIDKEHPIDAKMIAGVEKLSASIEELRMKMRDSE